MDERPVDRETVVVDSGSRGGGGAIVAIVVVLILAVLAFLFFSGYLGGRGKGDINVNVDLPQVNLPPIHVDNPAPPPAQQQPAQPQQPATNQSGK